MIDTEVAEALESGAFGVRGGTDGHVASLGEYPDIWGIEPDGATWVLPLDKALIYGVPLAYGVLPGEKPLTFGYDWNVVAWWLVPTRDTKPLLVGTCVPSTGANVPLVSHEPVGRGPTLLPKGDPPTYCGPNVTLGSRLLHLASLAVPLWPQPLNATAMVGVSGSGKAREFSPFHHYEMSQFADAEISQPAAVTKLGDPICFETFSDPDTGDDTRDTSVEDPSCNFAFDWVTARGEGTGGNPTGSLETFVISAVDNNGAKTVISFTEPPLDGECRQGGEASQLICECDGRAVEGAPCDRIELQGLTLSKTGVFSICVEDLGGTESSGLTIRACTEDFHIKPNA